MGSGNFWDSLASDIAWSVGDSLLPSELESLLVICCAQESGWLLLPIWFLLGVVSFRLIQTTGASFPIDSSCYYFFQVDSFAGSPGSISLWLHRGASDSA